MWKIYLFMFIVTVIVSILWVHILSNEKNNEDESD
jgi:hypothetical protein